MGSSAQSMPASMGHRDVSTIVTNRTCVQFVEIITQEIDVRIDPRPRVLACWVFLLNNRVNRFDQTGQIVVERPSKDEDNDSVVRSVIPESLRANWIPVHRSRTLRAVEIEESGDFFARLRAADELFRSCMCRGSVCRQRG